MGLLLETWVEDRIALGPDGLPTDRNPLANPERLTSKSKRGFRVLVIDDDLDIRESLIDLLELENYIVDAAADFDSAIEFAQTYAPNVAIIDIRLGGKNGIDLIPLLKSLSPATFCIVVTAYRDAVLTKKAFEAGADEFFHKPLDPKELSELVRRVATGGSEGDG